MKDKKNKLGRSMASLLTLVGIFSSIFGSFLNDKLLDVGLTMLVLAVVFYLFSIYER